MGHISPASNVGSKQTSSFPQGVCYVRFTAFVLEVQDLGFDLTVGEKAVEKEHFPGVGHVAEFH